MKKLQLLLILALFTFSIKAQNVSMNTEMNNIDNSTYEVSNNEIVPLLKETTFTYKYKGDDVLVVFRENEHIEYFNNKRYYIKSTIEWTADNECFMTLQESNLPRFPFKSGVKLHMKN